MNRNIAVVDDDNSALKLVECVLKENNYKVYPYSTGNEILTAVKSKKFNLIVLDLVLPDIDGLEVCKILRKDKKTTNIPIIMLTCRTKLEEEIEGLETGADLYLTKPFEKKRLIEYVKVLLRRIELDRKIMEDIIDGNIHVKMKDMVIKIGREKKELNTLEFKVIVHFLKNKDKILPRNALYKHILKYDRNPGEEERSIEMAISRLRKKYDELKKKIETIGNKGYKYHSGE